MFKHLCLAGSLLATGALKATPVEDSTEIIKKQYEAYIDSVRSAQKYETGLINLPGGIAAIKDPAGLCPW